MSVYDPPNPEELREILQTLGLSRSQAGRLADVTGNRIGKWCSTGAAMPYSVLFTIVAKHCNLQLSEADWRSEIKAIFERQGE